MDYRKELAMLVNYVKEFVKAKGGKITQIQMSKKMGYTNKDYLTHLINGHENVNEGHILKFKEVFKNELPDTNQVTKDDIIILKSYIDVILRELARFQSDLPGGRDASAYMKEKLKEIELISIERKQNQENRSS